MSVDDAVNGWTLHFPHTMDKYFVAELVGVVPAAPSSGCTSKCLDIRFVVFINTLNSEAKVTVIYKYRCDTQRHKETSMASLVTRHRTAGAPFRQRIMKVRAALMCVMNGQLIDHIDEVPIMILTVFRLAKGASYSGEDPVHQAS
jgi:hypothetical protein